MNSCKRAQATEIHREGLIPSTAWRILPVGTCECSGWGELERELSYLGYTSDLLVSLSPCSLKGYSRAGCAALRPALSLQPGSLSCDCAKSWNKRWKNSLQSATLSRSQAKQVYFEKMGFRPEFSIATFIFLFACAQMCPCDCVVCVPGGMSRRISTALQVTAAHCQ